jgi:hypothetical protein
VTLAAFVLPFTRTTLNAMNLTNDARNLSGATSMAKMRAAADFTKARIFVSLTGRTFIIQRWRKNPGTWVTEGGVQALSATVTFGFGTLATPPPNTQAVIGQAAPCLDDAGAVVADTGCNSPTSAGAFYISDGQTIYGVTTTAGGMIQLWQANLASMSWALK